jgi:hypothetical protein
LHRVIYTQTMQRQKTRAPVDNNNGLDGSGRNGVHPIGYNVHDGTGEKIKRLNTNFRALIRLCHKQYKQATSSFSKKQIALSVYHSILHNGGQFYNADGVVKEQDDAIKKIQKALKDMQDRGENDAPTRSSVNMDRRRSVSLINSMISDTTMCVSQEIPRRRSVPDLSANGVNRMLASTNQYTSLLSDGQNQQFPYIAPFDSNDFEPLPYLEPIPYEVPLANGNCDAENSMYGEEFDPKDSISNDNI